jgi:hypothetical protein
VRRLALVTTGMAVAVMAGCATAPPVPQWKDPGPEPAVTGAVAAPVRSAQPPPGQAPPASREPQASPEQTPGPGAVPSDERFLAAVRGQLPEMAMDLRSEEITEMGGQACESLAAGTARRSVAAELAEYGVPAADARKLVSLARTTLCRH